MNDALCVLGPALIQVGGAAAMQAVDGGLGPVVLPVVIGSVLGHDFVCHLPA